MLPEQMFPGLSFYSWIGFFGIFYAHTFVIVNSSCKIRFTKLFLQFLQPQLDQVVHHLQPLSDHTHMSLINTHFQHFGTDSLITKTLRLMRCSSVKLPTVLQQCPLYSVIKIKLNDIEWRNKKCWFGRIKDNYISIPTFPLTATRYGMRNLVILPHLVNIYFTP